MRTKCFSNRLIRGVGNLSYTVSFSAMRISLQLNRIKVDTAQSILSDYIAHEPQGFPAYTVYQ